jgi:hypothetical protein
MLRADTTVTATFAVVGPPAVTVKFARAVSFRGRLKVTVGCPADQVSCAGAIKLTQKVRNRKPPLLGKASFHVRGGGKQAITIKLSRAVMRLLRKGRTVHAIAAILARNPEGERFTHHQSLTLRLAGVRRSAGTALHLTMPRPSPSWPMPAWGWGLSHPFSFP